MRTPSVVAASACLALLLAACSQPAGDAGAAAPVPRATGPVEVADVLDAAPYRIQIPARWNGDLVMLLHGYEPVGAPRETPIARNDAEGVFLARGFAVAYSAYATQGWAVAEAIQDNERLRADFARKYGKPGHTYAVGFSMGGHLALASIEQHPGDYDGALSMCGVNMPASTAFNEGVLTALVAFDYLFPTALPQSEAGLADPQLPAAIDPAAIEAALAGNETAATRLAQGLSIERADLAGAIMLRYVVLKEMQQRANGFPADNQQTVYRGFGDDEAFNRNVRRYAGDAAAMAYVSRNAQLTGDIRHRVVLQRNQNDPTVPPNFDAIYPELVAHAGHTDQLVLLPSVGHGHCAFLPENLDAAFAALIR